MSKIVGWIIVLQQCQISCVYHGIYILTYLSKKCHDVCKLLSSGSENNGKNIHMYLYLHIYACTHNCEKERERLRITHSKVFTSESWRVFGSSLY